DQGERYLRALPTALSGSYLAVGPGRGVRPGGKPVAGHDLYRAWLLDRLADERGRAWVHERRGLLERELDWLEMQGLVADRPPVQRPHGRAASARGGVDRLVTPALVP